MQPERRFDFSIAQVAIALDAALRATDRDDYQAADDAIKRAIDALSEMQSTLRNEANE
jgi:hypothetical protein